MNIEMLEGIKERIDPKNIFAINNTIYRVPGEKEYDELDKVNTKN